MSDDCGGSWRASGLEGREVWQVRDDGEGTLYAGTAPTGLYRSEDRGDSWTELAGLAELAEAGGWCIPLDPPIKGRTRALVVSGPHIWAGVEVGGIAVSEDRGDTWSVVLPGDNPDLHMMFPHPAEPETMFASTGYGRLDGVAEMVEGNAGVFRSEDGGGTWTYAWKGITPRYSRPMCIDHRAPYGLTVASAPTAFSSHRDRNGAQAMLLRSEDGGESWRSLCDEDHSPSAANFHGLTVDPEVPAAFLLARTLVRSGGSATGRTGSCVGRGCRRCCRWRRRVERVAVPRATSGSARREEHGEQMDKNELDGLSKIVRGGLDLSESFQVIKEQTDGAGFHKLSTKNAWAQC